MTKADSIYEPYRTFTGFMPSDIVVRLIVDGEVTELGSVTKVDYSMNKSATWDVEMVALILGSGIRIFSEACRANKVHVSLLGANEYGGACELKFLDVQDFLLKGSINAASDNLVEEVVTFNTREVQHWAGVKESYNA